MLKELPSPENAAVSAALLHERFEAGLLPELTALPQWVLWKQQLIDGKLKKVPYSPDGSYLIMIAFTFHAFR